MLFRTILISFLVSWIAQDSIAKSAYAQAFEQETEVALRMIGHQVLLVSGDSTSRVLPIEQDGIAYRIRFEKPFAFHADLVSSVIDSVVAVTQLANEYTVQFEVCETGQVAHMYKFAKVDSNAVLACGGRNYPEGCYNLLITPLDNELTKSEVVSVQADDDYAEVYRLLIILIVIVLLLAGVVVYLLNRKQETAADPNIVVLGSYRFNKKTMNLMFENERIELTSKEAELLSLLCSSANDTVEREEILKQVWGDEGAYVGRTLDVFISKLRKKLEADSNVRIVNIRGIGYKLVLGD